MALRRFSNLRALFLELGNVNDKESVFCIFNQIIFHFEVLETFFMQSVPENMSFSLMVAVEHP